MDPATATHGEPATDLHMGSEYSDAKSFLAREPSGTLGRIRKKREPQHGSNDSDFGIPDQRPD